MKSLLPIILIILALTGAIVYSLAKKITPPKEISRFGISANKINTVGEVGVTPSASGFKVTPSITPSVTPTMIPTPKVTLPDVQELTTPKKDLKIGSTTKTTVCTPVYGQANTCTEHVVVDTGAADSIFFNMAGISYLGGLVAFIKAKKSK